MGKGKVKKPSSSSTQADPAKKPKELSSNLKGLRFMARKDDSTKSKSKIEENNNNTQWILPEKIEATTIFSPKMDKLIETVFRKNVNFSNESDSVFELRLAQKKRTKQQEAQTSKKKKKKSEESTFEFPSRISWKNRPQVDEGDESDSSLDELEMAEQYENFKKKRHS